MEKQNNKEVSSLVQIICKKLDTERQKSLIETSKKDNSTLEESLCRKLDAIEKERLGSRKVVNKGRKKK